MIGKKTKVEDAKVGHMKRNKVSHLMQLSRTRFNASAMKFLIEEAEGVQVYGSD